MSWLNRMFPWPAKRDRRAAVAAARDEHHRSRANAAKSRIVRQQIVRLAAENHYAERIENQILRGHRDGSQ